MDKIDYRRIEKLILEALLTLRTRDLMRLLEELQRKQAANVEVDLEDDDLLPSEFGLEAMIRALKKDLKRVKELDPDAFKEQLSGSSRELGDLKKELEEFSPEDWEMLNDIREKIHAIKMEHAGGSRMEADQAQIDANLLREEKRGKFSFRAKKKWDTV